MDSSKFVYVTYIATTPEKLWAALTSSDFTEKYWGGGRIHSDWKVGSPVTHVKPEGTPGADWQGQVLQCKPPRLLSYTFQAVPGEQQASRVVFEIEHVGSVVKLTLTHDQLDDKSLKAITHGWPAILSSLKSLLEGGSPLTYERWF